MDNESVATSRKPWVFKSRTNRGVRSFPLQSFGPDAIAQVRRRDEDLGPQHFVQFGPNFRYYRPSRRKFLIVFGFLLTLGILLQIWVVNRLSTFGEQLTRIENLKSGLKLENQVLENAIAQKSSLQTIRVYAANLGFVSPKNIEYIDTRPKR